MITFSNHTAIVTGASRGIGEAAARKLTEYGSNVVLLARSSNEISRLANELGDRALPIACDVTNFEDVQEAVSASVKRFGAVNLLVNNAGLIDPIARIENSSPEAWANVIDVNLKGAYFCMRAVYGAMRTNGGVIVNLSSGAATSALEGWSHYCASKAGLLALTKCANKEWAPHGVHVVGLSPGTVATNMQARIKASGINPVSQLEWSSHIPAEWVGETIAWLTQPEAREFDGTDFSLKTEAGLRAVGINLGSPNTH